MQVVRFECPHCSANLKIRETDLVAKAVDCPECHQPIVIGRDQAGNLAARKPDAPSTKAKRQAKAETDPEPNYDAIDASGVIPHSKEWWAQREAADRSADAALARKLVICQGCLPPPAKDDETTASVVH